MTGSVGLVVNPNASRDVRRLTSLARTIDVHERVHTTSRMLLGLAAAGTASAAAAMAAAGVNRVVTWGGDGTNRAVAIGWPNVLLVPLPGGTNNAFALPTEPTAAGLAVGVYAADPERYRALVRLTPGPATVALDGEREIVLESGRQADVRLVTGGPWLLDVRSLLERAAHEGRFSLGHPP